LGVFAKFLDKGEQDSLSAKSRKFVARRLTWLVVMVLYLSLGAVALTWSSVVVLAEEGKGAGRHAASTGRVDGAAPLARRA
jgi:hypothetical protein